MFDVKSGDKLYCIDRNNLVFEGCFESKDSAGLSYGSCYIVKVYMEISHLVLVENDNGMLCWYKLCYFSSLKELRKKKLNEVGLQSGY